MAFPGDWSTSQTFTVDNPSSSIDDPWMVFALSNCNASWWSAVQSDGGDIRVSKGDDTQFPCVFLNFDSASKTGVLYFRWLGTLAASGTQQVKIWCGNASATPDAAGDTFGQHEVFRPAIKMFIPDGIGTDLTASGINLTATAGAVAGNTYGPIPGTKATTLQATNGTAGSYGVSASSPVTAPPFTAILVGKPNVDHKAMVAVSIADSGTSNNVFYQYWRGDVSDNVHAISDPGSTAAGSGVFTKHAWNIAASVFASTTSRTAYLNGVAGTPNTTPGSPSGIDKVTVGCLNTSSQSIGWEGEASHFILYDDTTGGISPAEISYIQSMFNDNAGHFNATQVDFITLTHPPQGMVYQRTGFDALVPGSGVADITNIEVFAPAGKTIEARFNGGSWASIGTVTSNGTLRGTLSTQSAGQGTLEVRLSDATSVTDSVADIGIGDNFLLVGHSVVEGRGDNPQSYTGTNGLKAYVFRQDDLWIEANDPVDTGTSNGTHWPHMITELMESQQVPIGLVSTGRGSTDLGGSSGASSWNPGTQALTTYMEMRAQCSASRVDDFLAVLGEFGVNAVALTANIQQAAFNTALDTFVGASGLQAHVQGAPPLVISIFGETSQPDATELNNVRYAIIEAIDDNDNVFEGPNLIDLTYGDSLHPESDGELESVGTRWASALLTSIYGLGNNLAPKITSATRVGTTVTLTYNKALAAGTTYSAFTFIDNGGAVTVNSATKTGSATITLVLNSAPSGVGEYVIFASGDTASGATVPTNTIGMPARPQTIAVTEVDPVSAPSRTSVSLSLSI
jgi:hypothetical protein